ncbi:hypothetical protein C0995_007361, partial [Termitomyces sp. Mi166
SKGTEFPASPLSSGTALTSDQIAKLSKVDNSMNLLILPVRKVSTTWTGHILDKDDGKWAEWSYKINLELSMVQLWEYVFNTLVAPHSTYEPCASWALVANNHLACSFIKQAISMLEQRLYTDEWDPVALWAYLKQRHGSTMPVQQEALMTKCSLSESLTKTTDDIIEKINHAFNTGEVTKELIQSITIISALSDKSYMHIHSIIFQDLTATSDKKYGPTEIQQFLKGKQTLIDTDKSTLADIILTVHQP